MSHLRERLARRYNVAHVCRSADARRGTYAQYFQLTDRILGALFFVDARALMLQRVDVAGIALLPLYQS